MRATTLSEVAMLGLRHPAFGRRRTGLSSTDRRPARRLAGGVIVPDHAARTVRLVGCALDPHRRLTWTATVDRFADDMTVAETSDTIWMLV
jgi:hypothetical protein